MLLRPFLWLLLPLALAGCVNFGLGGESDSRTVVHFVLEDAGRPLPSATPAPYALLMTDTTAGAFYDTDGMAYSNAAGTRGYYKFARWSERPGKRFTDLLLGRLEKENRFATVALPGNNVRGDWLLTTDILDFHHDAVSQPGRVKMEMRAEVIDLKQRKLLARKTFTQFISVSSHDAAGAHKAFNEATTRTLDDLSDWLRELASKS